MDSKTRASTCSFSIPVSPKLGNRLGRLTRCGRFEFIWTDTENLLSWKESFSFNALHAASRSHLFVSVGRKIKGDNTWLDVGIRAFVTLPPLNVTLPPLNVTRLVRRVCVGDCVYAVISDNRESGYMVGTKEKK